MADEQVKAEVEEPKDVERETAQKAADAINAARSGVGTRQTVSRTRGKGSIVVTYENFDDSKPETMPTSVAQFQDIVKASESQILSYMILGYNESQYVAASDPIKEFVNPAWPEDAQNQFRLVVRNYSKGANVPLEKAVELIKPGFDVQFAPKG